ncbi:transmembrane protein 272-like [Bufo bufo]|uniref:transmembrane protein 272-like n=1 Tax=Bufo bufo TaxID=8384 RepID=UPI001ABDC9DA|nr:transmembrane protein 272-like [Bufo bufo]
MPDHRIPRQIFYGELSKVSELINLVIWAALGIAMIVIGSIHIHDCAIEPNIPIYLVVAGAVSLLLVVLWPLMLCAPRVAYTIDGVLGLFTLAWFIAGSVWVFRIYQTDPRDCNDTLYKFAFGILIFKYAYAALFVAGYIIMCLCCSCWQ